MKVFAVLLLVLLVIALTSLALLTPAFSRVDTVEVQTEEQAAGEETTELERRVSGLEDQSDPAFPTGQAAGAGSLSFLFGAFCALWAQNTGRNAWLWFFLGLFFNIFAVLALLVRNSDDRAAA